MDRSIKPLAKDTCDGPSLDFPTVTPRLNLPVLYPGQAQKEFFVNEALARLDAVTHPVVEGTAVAPPADPHAGQCWIVASGSTGLFADRSHALAFHDGVQWSFIAAVPGMTVFDRSSGTLRRFGDTWSTPATIVPPAGGVTVDAEARHAIVALLQALEGLSILKHG